MGDNVRINIGRRSIIHVDTGIGKDRFLADMRGERMIRRKLQRDLMRCDIRGMQRSRDSATIKHLQRAILSIVSTYNSSLIRTWLKVMSVFR